MERDKTAATDPRDRASQIDSRSSTPAFGAETGCEEEARVPTTPIPSEPQARADLGPTQSDKTAYPALASALKPAHSHFRAVAQAYMYSKGPLAKGQEASSGADQAAMARFYPHLHAAFVERYGIAEYHWCAHAPAAAVLTSRRRGWRAECHVWLFINPRGAWPAIEATLNDCSVLKDEIEDSLRGSARGRCLHMLFEVITTALALLDDFTPPPASAAEQGSQSRHGRKAAARDNPLEHLRSRMGKVRGQFEQAARRSMQLVYLSGMFAWTLLIAAATVAILAIDGTALGDHLAINGSDARRAIVSVLAGTAGAFMSVLLRMTRDQGIEVDVLVGRTIGHVLGASRPLLGAISGIGVYLLLASGLIPLAPSDPSQVNALYAACAFAAGFSERLVPDMLGIATNQLTSSGA
ncbi:hypothetical protein OM076_13530 [Solirubrobacter ginsenosidimutans]|uniref:Uncharacterized protein n=1 Tax=Solirubrobacter ginsenosidimutans TaxID=490573 RepID=A0A9X3S561_9ACTN|nr:hypothetical protein [Solirubrobacter ginsenosidimutans]MDA0161293.1 hypothetical protein [Solirubrobacter ginsenosidimutans]